MFRSLVGGLALATMIGSVVADDKKPVVSWEKEANGVDLKLDVGKDTLKINAFMGENGVIANCKLTVDKDSVVTAEVTDVEVKGTFPAAPPKGLKFTFKWKVDGDIATLSELMGKGIEEYKEVVEGDYKKKK